MKLSYLNGTVFRDLVGPTLKAGSPPHWTTGPSDRDSSLTSRTTGLELCNLPESHGPTVDGSLKSGKLTSWGNGSFSPLFIGFQHHPRWLFGISAINSTTHTPSHTQRHTALWRVYNPTWCLQLGWNIRKNSLDCMILPTQTKDYSFQITSKLSYDQVCGFVLWPTFDPWPFHGPLPASFRYPACLPCLHYLRGNKSLVHSTGFLICFHVWCLTIQLLLSKWFVQIKTILYSSTKRWSTMVKGATRISHRIHGTNGIFTYIYHRF